MSSGCNAVCSASQREIVEGATRCPKRDAIFAAVAASALPRSYRVSASSISGRIGRERAPAGAAAVERNVLQLFLARALLDEPFAIAVGAAIWRLDR
jgi:hypothetical protein